MADGKKSFILYCDLIHTVRKMPKDKVGELFMLILSYVNDENPESDDLMVDLVFEPVKQQLKRDLKDWEGIKNSRSEAGKRGAAIRWDGKTKQTIANDGTAISPMAKIAVNGNVTVTDTVTVNESGNSPQVFNAETEILKNQIEVERICMAANFSKNMVKEVLHKFHLHLESNDKYPQTRKQVFAGFEKWLLNEKKFSKNGKGNISEVGKRIEFDKP